MDRRFADRRGEAGLDTRTSLLIDRKGDLSLRLGGKNHAELASGAKSGHAPIGEMLEPVVERDAEWLRKDRVVPDRERPEPKRRRLALHEPGVGQALNTEGPTVGRRARRSTVTTTEPSSFQLASQAKPERSKQRVAPWIEEIGQLCSIEHRQHDVTT